MAYNLKTGKILPNSFSTNLINLILGIYGHVVTRSPSQTKIEWENSESIIATELQNWLVNITDNFRFFLHSRKRKTSLKRNQIESNHPNVISNWVEHNSQKSWNSIYSLSIGCPINPPPPFEKRNNIQISVQRSDAISRFFHSRISGQEAHKSGLPFPEFSAYTSFPVANWINCHNRVFNCRPGFFVARWF